MKNNRPLIILGSARKNSDTKKLIERLFAEGDCEIIDLLDYNIYPYDYSANYPVNDEFFKIIERLLQFRTIIFATPVYWYSMSGTMKLFFDRLTDLMTIKKELGRKLKGKKTFLVAVGTDIKLPDGFEVPFRLTSQYLDMDFISVYYCSREKLDEELKNSEDLILKVKTL